MMASMLATSTVHNQAAAGMAAGETNDANARIKNAFKLGLIGDALALGGHYEYDARKIKASGGYRDFSAPGEANNGIGWGTANDVFLRYLICFHVS